MEEILIRFCIILVIKGIYEGYSKGLRFFIRAISFNTSGMDLLLNTN